MKALLGSLLSSKKFLATLAAILVWLLGRLGFDASEEILLPVIGSLAAFVLAQGWADAGPKEGLKEAARQGLIAKGDADPSEPQ